MGAMLAHAAMVFVVHSVFVWPFLSPGLVLGILILSVLHLFYDVVRSRAVGKWGASLGAFFVDQSLHVLSIYVLWRIVNRLGGGAPAAWSPPDAWLACFAPLLESPKPAKVGHDLKHDVKVLRRAGVELAGADFDAELASYCIGPGMRRHDIATQAQHYFEALHAPVTELTGTGRKAVPLSEVPVAAIGEWAAEGVDYVLRLRDAFTQAHLASTDCAAGGRRIPRLHAPLSRMREPRGDSTR